MIYKKIHKIKTFFRRYINRKQGIHRPASYPYITGDGFRSISNFIFDQFLDFNPEDINFGDIVFVRNNYVEFFFKKIHPKIKYRYILISHNEDYNLTNKFNSYIDDKIIHWYAQNANFKNEKLTLLPIGIQNFNTGKEDNFIEYIDNIKNLDYQNKKNRILFGFNVHPNIPSRQEAFNYLSKSDLCDHINKKRKEYYETLINYKYMASPEGAGIDCHRTWEAIYLGVIPIIIRSDFSEQLEKQGFPILIIDKWSDIQNLSEEFLNKFYEDKKNYFGKENQFIKHWFDLFSNHRHMVK